MPKGIYLHESRPCSEETKRKIKASNLISMKSPEVSHKISLAQKGVLEKGWVKEQDSKIMKQYYKEHPCSEETKKKISLVKIGHPCYAKSGYSKNRFREDLNQFFRSRWEANVARILDYLGIKWKYESQRFYFDNCNFSYCPDFYLPQLDLYTEVKGYRGNGLEKLEKMYQECPKINLKVIDGEVYNKLKEMYKDKISNWEY